MSRWQRSEHNKQKSAQQRGIAQAAPSQKHERFHQTAVEDQDDQDDEDGQDNQDVQEHPEHQEDQEQLEQQEGQEHLENLEHQEDKDRQHQEACRVNTRMEGTDNHQTDHYKYTRRLTPTHHHHHQKVLE